MGGEARTRAPGLSAEDPFYVVAASANGEPIRDLGIDRELARPQLVLEAYGFRDLMIF